MKAIRLMEKRGVDFNILTLLTDVNIKSPEILYRFFRKNKFNFLSSISFNSLTALNMTKIPQVFPIILCVEMLLVNFT